MSFLTVATATANFIGDSTSFLLDGAKYCLRNTSGVIGSAGLGAIAGPFTAMGGRVGFFQGAVQGTLHTMVLRPIGTYISKHAGSGKNQFNSNAVTILTTAGILADFALPIILTRYYGKPAMEGLANILPHHLSWIAKPKEEGTYTIIGGIMLNILPSLLSIGITTLQYAQQKKN
jgi:hypothetical protein